MDADTRTLADRLDMARWALDVALDALDDAGGTAAETLDDAVGDDPALERAVSKGGTIDQARAALAVIVARIHAQDSSMAHKR